MMTMPTIAEQRLYHQRIAHSDFQRPEEVVRWLGAVQAQDYASAEWTIGLRFAGATPARIEEAIANRTLIRTWLLRGTLHMVAADDLRWILALLSPTLVARYAALARKVGLDEETVAKSYAVFTTALQGSNQLIRKELFAVLERAGISLDAMQMGQLLNRAALEGLICLGSMQGKQTTYTLLDEWLPQQQARHADREEALAELALRYFTSHGPTTLQDFVWWTGLQMADARSGFEAIKVQLVEERVHGKRYWRVDTLSPLPQRLPNVYLLPGFDEFVLGYSDRGAFLQAEHGRLITGINAVFAYTMILDGQIVGTWKRTLRKGAVEIAFSPFASLPEDLLQAFGAAAQRYGEFLGLPVVL